MTQHYHVLVWIDHHEAKIFQFNTEEVERSRIRSHHPHQHLHHKTNSSDAGRAPLDKDFLERVTQAVLHAGTLLITGPASAKQELAAHIQRTQPALAQRIAGIEPLDHPSDRVLVAFARTFFKASDRMHS